MRRESSTPTFLATRAGLLTCGALATLAGAAQLVLAGAPLSYPVVNLVALVVGVILVAVTASTVDRHFDSIASPVLVVGALVLVGTAILGADVDGATRWLRVGPLLLQLGLVLVPGLLVLYAQRPTAVASVAMAAAAAALALQPDRSIASALAVGLLVLLISRPKPPILLAFLAALASMVATFFQSDVLSPVEHVEGVHRTAMAAGPLESVLVFSGTLLMFLPAVAGGFGTSRRARALRVFGTTWLVLVLAALVANYPTPLLGYGSSAIIGYSLCALFVGKNPGAPRDNPAERRPGP